MSLFKSVKMYVRSVTGSDVEGKWQQTVGAPVGFKGTFQPANGQDMQALPEGRRETAVFKIYADKSFDTVTSSDNPDLISVNNITYEIISVEPWQNGLINHYKYMVQEKRDK